VTPALTVNDVEPAIIIHGGAWDIPKSLHRAHKKGIGQALETGRAALAETDDSLKTILAIIRCLEDDPTFDAGTGSFLNSAGEVEMDAGIMVGKDLSVGAVAAIQYVRHPIDVANIVRTGTQHCILAGEGATDFARLQGFKIVDTEELLVGREKKLYKKLQTSEHVRIKSFFEIKEQRRDTVGAVVINSRGNIVSATSTGGTPHKMKGRVGDSPLIGSGFYADDEVGGASSTGWGEGIMRVVLAKRAVDYLNNGYSAGDAAAKAVKDLHDRVDAEGGIIILDRNGQSGYAFNTPFMAVGIASLTEIKLVSLGK